MANAIGKDPMLRAAQIALDGLSLRQKMISQNLANVDTPGYQARTIKFEDAVRAASQGVVEYPLSTTNTRHIDASGSPAAGAHSVARAGGSTRADGNNVDIDVELLEMTETGIAYQALTQAASKKLALLKNIAMSR